MRGYFGVVLYEPKTIENLGTIFRSAHCFGASFIATIGDRYTRRHKMDTTDAVKHVPYFHFNTIPEFMSHRPDKSKLVGVEVNGTDNLNTFRHLESCLYVLGGEDRTLPNEILDNCDYTIKIDTKFCLNLAVAASIVMYSRNSQIKN